MGSEVTDLLLAQETKETNQQIQENKTGGGKHEKFIFEAKKEDDANDLIKDLRPEFVVMIGLEEYGKTTFLGSMYHQLRSNGKIDHQLLIDSDTLAGFENKVFLRAMNKDGKSDVPRTTGRDAFILSLELKDEQSGARRHLVISDRAGETYFQYLSSDTLVEKDKTLSRADRILLFVDSEKMVGTKYVSMQDDYRSLLKRLKKADKLPVNALVYVVFNKYDKIAESKKGTFESRKAAMLDIFKIVKDKVDEIFLVDSKHLLETENESDVWKLQRMLINPV